jgi:hypothetical protein
MNIGDTLILHGTETKGNAEARVVGRSVTVDFDLDYAPPVLRNDWNEKIQKASPLMVPNLVTLVITQKDDGGRRVRVSTIFGRQVLKSGELSETIGQIHIYHEKPEWLKDLVSRFERGELS